MNSGLPEVVFYLCFVSGIQILLGKVKMLCECLFADVGFP